MAKIQILIVEDELIVAQNLQRWLEHMDYVVTGIAVSGEEAIQLVLDRQPDLVLVDIRLQGNIDGVQVVEQIQHQLDIPMIYLTAYTDEITLQRAKTTSPLAYLIKPFDKRELHITIEMALYKHAMERRLKASEQWLATILRSIGEAVIACDTSQCVTFMNPAAERLTGWVGDEALGRAVTDVFRTIHAETHEPLEPPIQRALRDGTPVPLRSLALLVRHDGSTLPIDDSAAPIKDDREALLGGVLVFHDTTRRREFERRLLEGQKLESLGILAGGVAHDFNNYLSIILGNASLALLDLEPDTPLHELIEPIEVTARRAAELTNQMLAYTGKDRIEVRPVDLTLLITEMQALLHASLARKVQAHYQLAPHLPTVLADATRLRQLLLTLVVNASESFGGREGTVTIATDVRHIDQDYLTSAYLIPELPDGEYVCLEVHDHGCGIEASLMSRIFEPFFSTKFTGRGMGLAAALGIVRSHNGAIRVASTVGQGTTFTVLFAPCATAIATAETAPSNSDVPGEEAPEPAALPEISSTTDTGYGTVLIIDDEVEVCHLIARSLEYIGYTSLTAVEGQAGVDMFQANREVVSCVLLDMTMPHLNGEQVFHMIRTISPDVPIVLMSGYNTEHVTSRLTAHNAADFLKKPFTTPQLYATLQHILDPSSTRS